MNCVVGALIGKNCLHEIAVEIAPDRINEKGTVLTATIFTGVLHTCHQQRNIIFIEMYCVRNNTTCVRR